jgi:hypothetical protein
VGLRLEEKKNGEELRKDRGKKETKKIKKNEMNESVNK